MLAATPPAIRTTSAGTTIMTMRLPDHFLRGGPSPSSMGSSAGLGFLAMTTLAYDKWCAASGRRLDEK
ncbi:hypothetical protein E6W36_14630 [Hankyongella ginsenosidimutans]|uniref:Uncharacterized protein n=1 Tax=Hankyongella ginsenosidimutans TaxID=1763828 RepID=A0A4D7C5B6_9SPHN|nr:hypothetical protein [Hankyongella ginsenosidimutans]QCI80301.1 hypothetical protein E6W36_14630 [Hankyongella ginsenosidimutans]